VELSGVEVAGTQAGKVARFERWNIVVNTAGVIVRKPLVETIEEEYDHSFAVNAKIPFFLMVEAFYKMADYGRIINMVTTQVAVTAATYSAYAGSKGPVEHFTRAFAKEIGHRGITVNCIVRGLRRRAFSSIRRRTRHWPGCLAKRSLASSAIPKMSYRSCGSSRHRKRDGQQHKRCT
jgi:NAD(P)-dependent dehydrogenase (short-subunit alcohol dehydrogenase family)